MCSLSVDTAVSNNPRLIVQMSLAHWILVAGIEKSWRKSKIHAKISSGPSISGRAVSGRLSGSSSSAPELSLSAKLLSDISKHFEEVHQPLETTTLQRRKQTRLCRLPVSSPGITNLESDQADQHAHPPRQQRQMASTVAVGVGIAAAAFFVCFRLPFPLLSLTLSISSIGKPN